MSNIQITYEIAGTALANLPDETIAEIKSDVNGFLVNKAGVNVDGFSAEIAENSDKEINLCLPYYSWVEENIAKAVADGEVATVAGGTAEDNLARVPSGDGLDFNRNWHQFWHNARMAFTLQYDRIDNSYDGDFDVDNNPTHVEGGK